MTTGGNSITHCGEVHPLPTREGELILPVTLVFAAAGVLQIFPQKTTVQNAPTQRIQIFEVDFQPDTAGVFQLFEGQSAVSGKWTLQANQFFAWGGKFLNNVLNLSASVACTVQLEVRYRQY